MTSITLRSPRERSTEHLLVKNANKELNTQSVKLELRHNAGWPDRLWILPCGWVFWMELKAPGALPGALQEHRMEYLRGLGHDVAWFDDYDAAWAALKERV